MTDSAVSGEDLSPFEPAPSGEQAAWLGELQQHLRASEHVIRLGDPVDDDENDLVVYCDSGGRWQAGRYIGEIRFKGRTLRIKPRLGMPAIEQLLSGATNLFAVPGAAATQSTESFIARLMAAVWCRSLDQAARHGPPAFRRQLTAEGVHVRGHLDVRRTSRLRGAGSPHVASTTRSRDLVNDVARTLICAERVLTQHIGNDQWQTRRAREIVPLLRSANGARPPLPSERALRTVRYTPITRPYQELAALSWRIARLEGFSAANENGSADGLLLDVAELWELYVLHCFRASAFDHRVDHGTTDTTRVHLLHSRDDAGRGLGRLLPDVLVWGEDGQARVVADAKYKLLADSAERPRGVDRGDLYQLTSYLSRYSPSGQAVGALVYPGGDFDRNPSSAEQLGPWVSEAGHHVEFVRLPLDEPAAVARVERLTRAVTTP